MCCICGLWTLIGKGIPHTTSFKKRLTVEWGEARSGRPTFHRVSGLGSVLRCRVQVSLQRYEMKWLLGVYSEFYSGV